MSGENEFFQLVADILGVEPSALSFETAYGEIPSWDSIMQLRLAAEIGERYARPLPLESLVRTETLWAYFRHATGAPMPKAVAVDLDGTLWDGVIGEDGIAGIRPRLEFQRELLELKRRGILLVALSKNNPEDVEPVWAEARMALRREDFVAAAIDWGEKADNLKRIARELNLSPDAFVFVDDDPVQRERMRRLCPEVVVAAFPPRLGAYFPADVAVTEEDRERTAQYRAEAERRRFAAECAPGDFLARLGQWSEVRPLAVSDVARVAQLAVRANQFNLTTRRVTEAEVAGWVDEPGALTLVLRAGDRFGEHGLVAFARIEIRGARAELTDFTMSCRVMGRNLECELADELARRAVARGVAEIRGRYLPTAKNAPVADLLPRLGYKMQADGTWLWMS